MSQEQLKHSPIKHPSKEEMEEPQITVGILSGKEIEFSFPKASLLLTAQRFQGHKRLFIKKKRYTGQGKNTMN